MAIFRNSTAVPASGTNNNIMAGSKFEFLARPSAVQIWLSQDGAGIPGPDGARVDFTLGNVVVGDDLIPNPAASQGMINQREDGPEGAVGQAGDRIQLRVSNTDAVNAVNLNVLVKINELA